MSLLLLEYAYEWRKFILQITQAGRAIVASSKFTEEARRFLRGYKVSGVDDEVAHQTIVYRVAMALSGGEDKFGRALTATDHLEIERFINGEHKCEIEAAAEKIFHRLPIHSAR
jgi:hypothetical protein